MLFASVKHGGAGSSRSSDIPAFNSWVGRTGVAQCNTFPATCVATFNGIGQSNCSFCAREVLMATELTTASKMTHEEKKKGSFKR